MASIKVKVTTVMVDHYSYRVAWSAEDQEFVGTCAEFPSLSHLDAGRAEALHGIEELVRDVVADMQETGEDIPVPLSERSYSGEFVTRVPGELHRRLTIEAAEAGISLNRLVSYKLTFPLGMARNFPRPAAKKVRRSEKARA